MDLGGRSPLVSSIRSDDWLRAFLNGLREASISVSTWVIGTVGSFTHTNVYRIIHEGQASSHPASSDYELTIRPKTLGTVRLGQVWALD